MELIRGIAFDLDDTLYFEVDYILSGFRRIAEIVGPHSGGENAAFDWLEKGFRSGIRGDAFDRLLLQFPDISNSWTVADLIQLYRVHSPRIEMDPSIRSLISNAGRSGIRIALITDGPAESQSRKVDSLDIRDYFDPLILTDEWGIEYRKPHARSFTEVMQRWCFSPSQLVYVGDNPEKDFYAPRALGWHTVRLRTGRQLRHLTEASSPEYSPEFEVYSLHELLAWLNASAKLEVSSRETSE